MATEECYPMVPVMETVEEIRLAFIWLKEFSTSKLRIQKHRNKQQKILIEYHISKIRLILNKTYIIVTYDGEFVLL